MGPRVPWDEIGIKFPAESQSQLDAAASAAAVVDITPGAAIATAAGERDWAGDVKTIAQRALFGAVAGSITGAVFGVVDVLRDTKAMRASTKVATAKVWNRTYMFGGFFAAYHLNLQTLTTFSPYPKEFNIGLSAVTTLAPLVVMPPLRKMFPYGLMLITLDIINGIGSSAEGGR